MRYKLATYMAWPFFHGPRLSANRCVRWYFKHVIFPLAGV